jgi:hypothetical protein
VVGANQAVADFDFHRFLRENFLKKKRPCAFSIHFFVYPLALQVIGMVGGADNRSADHYWARLRLRI